MTFQDKLSKNKIWQFHQLIFPLLVFGFIYICMAGGEWNLCVFIQNAYTNAGIPRPAAWSIDKLIPIHPFTWMKPIYSSGTPVWILLPILFLFLYGKRRFCKLIGIGFFVYLTHFLIKISYPVSNLEIHQYGVDQLTNLENKSFWDIKWLDSLKNYYTANSALPSNHCSDTLLLLFALIDFNFFDRKENCSYLRKNNGIKLWVRIIMTIVFSIYTILICSSTFLLKVHYFLDFIASLIVCCFWYTICNIFPKIKFEEKTTLKIITNYTVACSYESKSKFDNFQTVSWAANLKSVNSIANYSKAKFYLHFILVDLMSVIIVTLEGLWGSSTILAWLFSN